MHYNLIATQSDQPTIGAFVAAHPDLELIGSRTGIFAAWLLPDPTPEKLTALAAMPGYVGVVDLQVG